MKNDQSFSDIEQQPYKTPPIKNKQDKKISSSLSIDDQIKCFICGNLVRDFVYCGCGMMKMCKQCTASKNHQRSIMKNFKKKQNKHICQNKKVSILLPKGLPNFGNTCYINSAIQCLRNLRVVGDYFSNQNKTYQKIKFKLQSQKQQQKKQQKKQYFLILVGQVTICLKQQFLAQYGKQQTPIYMERIRNTFSQLNSIYKGYTQQDASEFLQMLLQQLQNQYQESKKIQSGIKSIDKEDSVSTNQSSLFSTQIKNMQFVTQYLKGQVESLTLCEKCNKMIKNKDSFYILTLNFPIENESTFYIKAYIYQFQKNGRLKYHKFNINNPTIKDLQQGIEQSRTTFFYLSSFEEDIIQIKDENILQNLRIFKIQQYNSHSNPNMQLFGVVFDQNATFDAWLSVKFVHFKQSLFRQNSFQSISFKRPYFYNKNVSFNKFDILNQFKRYFLNGCTLKQEKQQTNQIYSNKLLTIFESVSVYFVTWPKKQRSMHQLKRQNISILIESLNNFQNNFQIWIDFKGHKSIQIQKLHIYSVVLSNQKYIPTQYQNYQQFCLNLNSMISNFTESQIINDYLCENCKQSKIRKKWNFLSFGECLIIRLARFSAKGRNFSKINDEVKFEFQISLSSHQGKQYSFRLCGLIIHSSDSSQYGHYYSIVKKNNIWYKMNDSQVTQFDVQKNIKELYRGAYLLFYEKLIKGKDNNFKIN